MRKWYVNGAEVTEVNVGDQVEIIEDGVQCTDIQGCRHWHVTDIEGSVVEITSLNGYRRYLC